jgi:hypothetical protein
MAEMADQISKRIRICYQYSVYAMPAYKHNSEHDTNM